MPGKDETINAAASALLGNGPIQKRKHAKKQSFNAIDYDGVVNDMQAYASRLKEDSAKEQNPIQFIRDEAAVECANAVVQYLRGLTPVAATAVAKKAD